MPTSSLAEVDSGDIISTRGANVFHLGQVEASRLALSATDIGTEMVVVVKIVQSPFAGHVGVPSELTTMNFVEGDLGDFRGAAMFFLISCREMPRMLQVLHREAVLDMI